MRGAGGHLGVMWEPSPITNAKDSLRPTPVKTASNGDMEPETPIFHNQTGFQQRNWSTNSVTKPSAYNLSSLQDILGQWGHRTCGLI